MARTNTSGPRILLILLLLGVALAGYILIVRQGSQIHLLSQSELNDAGAGNFTMLSQQRCQSSKLLANSGISQICTETFTPLKNTSNTTPKLITLFSYIFYTNRDALNYMNNVTKALNDTPWPGGLSLFNTKSVTSGGIELYYTTMRANSSAGQAIVTTAYVLKNSTILAASAMLPLANGSMEQGQELVTIILSRQYKIN